METLIEVTACGVCHSDLHLIDNDWGISTFPLVPGHEIVGRVAAVGSSVDWLKPGALVGVGWQRTACGHCEPCTTARDNMCFEKGMTCVNHWGGYADHHVTDAHYAFPLPKMDAKALAPLLCGGATVYGPLIHFLNNRHSRSARVGVVGLGGLGHLGVKFAVAMGYEVTLFSNSPSKQKEAEAMGVHHFVSSASEDVIKSVGRKFDLVLVTANVDLPWGAYVQTLRTDGTLCFVGIPPSPLTIHAVELLDQRLRIAGSPIASRSEIQSMLEFAERNEITADIETFKMADVNTALDRVRKGNIRYRAVLTNE